MGVISTIILRSSAAALARVMESGWVLALDPKTQLKLLTKKTTTLRSRQRIGISRLSTYQGFKQALVFLP